MQKTGRNGVLIAIAFWLLVGAVVNVGMAWGISLWESVHYPSVLDATMEIGSKIAATPWPADPPAGWSGEARPSSFGADRPWASCTHWVSLWPKALGQPLPESMTYHAVRWELGLPFKSMSWEGWSRSDPSATYAVMDKSLWRSGIVLDSGPILFGHKSRRLPLGVHWPLFISGAAFWGASLWLLSGGLRRWRSHWRAERGRCRHCGYDRAGLTPQTPCPECGRAPA